MVSMERGSLSVVSMHLIITEKHNTAKRIAHILSGGRAKHRKVEGIDVYTFSNTTVVGLRGHVLSLDFPEQYSRWQAGGVRKLIDAEVVHVPTERRYVRAIQKLARDAEEITIATDYDREGELIGVEALMIIEQAHPNLLDGVRVNRVRYSALTKQEIEEAFSHPAEVDFRLAASGEARQTIDLVWGAVLTRYLSIACGRLGDNFLSVGRVQSPTLALIVEREREIRAFVPQTYWEIEATLENGVVARHEHGRFDDKKEAEETLQRIGDRATLVRLDTGKRTDRPPTPFNTTEFLRAASAIGFSASNAMRIAESLYTNGYISYPRTDNTVYPKSTNLRDVLSALKDGDLGEYAAELLSKRRLSPTRGRKETTDHPPIYPVAAARRSQLSEQEWRVYELITRRFFATLADPCIVETQRAIFDANGEKLIATGLRVLDEGWRRYYTYSKVEDRPLPEMQVGERYAVLDRVLLEKHTKPPARYTQGALIKRMEELGIGTKSTRHEIIAKLYSRGYVVGNPMKPTQLSFSVIDALESNAPNITRPEMTRKLEEDMDRIAEGAVSESEVIDESRQMLRQVFDQLEKNTEAISKSIREGLREDAVLGRCPSCGRDLLIRRSRRGGRFAGCSGYPECTFTLPLPKSGKIVVSDRVCEKHGLFHITVVSKGRRPWRVGCPMCSFEEWRDSNTNGNKAQDLTAIKGIGETYAKRLREAGIESVDALRQLSPERVSELTGIPLSRVKRWRAW